MAYTLNGTHKNAMKPGRNMHIRDDSVDIWAGHIQASIPSQGNATRTLATINAIGPQSWYSQPWHKLYINPTDQTNFSEFSGTTSKSSVFIKAVLDRLYTPYGRQGLTGSVIDTGVMSIVHATIYGSKLLGEPASLTDAMRILRELTFFEQGALIDGRSGNLIWRNRTWLKNILERTTYNASFQAKPGDEYLWLDKHQSP